MAKALSKLDLFVVSRQCADQRHDQCRRACPAAGGGLGREGRHRHKFRAAHLAPARVHGAAGGGAAGLVDRRAGRAAHGLRGLWLSQRCGCFPRACGASSASRTMALATSTSARLRASATANSTRLRRCNGPCERTVARQRIAFLRRGRLLHARPQGPLQRSGKAGAERRAEPRNSRSASTPAACATSGTR